MVYVRSKVMEAVRQALASNPSPELKAILEQERLDRDEPADKSILTDRVFQYFLSLEPANATFVMSELNSYLAWFGKHWKDIDPGASTTITNIIKNIVGDVNHAMPLRIRLQDFKRYTLGLYDDFDPVEAVVFQALLDLKATSAAKVLAARSKLQDLNGLLAAG